MTLTTETLEAEAFDSALLDRAFALYARCYAPVDRAVFERDFRAKSYAVLIRDGAALVGFSTVERLAVDGIRVLYSGDTVIAPEHWGTQALSFGWLRQAGRVWAEAETPLYWLLITKGHRTYRYLPAFSRDYHPALDRPVPAETRSLMDRLGRLKFGARYEAATGTVRADPALPTAVLGDVEGGRPSRHAAFFEAMNPGFRQGDELLTLCRLAPDALTERARRQFLGAVTA